MHENEATTHDAEKEVEANNYEAENEVEAAKFGLEDLTWLYVHQSIKSIKTHLYSVMCHKRIRGA